MRTDVTAIKDPSRFDGSRWTHEALTHERLVHHVNGGPARGVSPIKAGESVTMVALLDFDSHQGEVPWHEMVVKATEVAQAAALWGLAPIAFRSSGGRGIHVYFLWDEPQDAYSVRMTLVDVLAMCGLKNAGGGGGLAAGQVEVFPKQDSVSATGFGNQFILPLAGESEPLDLTLGLCVGRDEVLTMQWPSSDTVVPRGRPERRAAVQGPDVDSVEKVRSALYAIPVDTLPYEEWHKIVCAVYEALGGSDDGLDLVLEWGEQFARHDETFVRERVWPYITERPGGVTRNTLYAKAKEHEKPVDIDALFDEVEEEASVEVALPAAAAPSLPGFARKKDGTILATIGNVLMALRSGSFTGWSFAYDQFRDELLMAPVGTQQWRPVTDAEMVRLREVLGRKDFEPVGRELIRDAVLEVADRNQFDSAKLWLSRLIWDGRPRVEQFLATYAGAEDTPYTRAVSLYLWTAMAGRVVVPACQADMTPVLVGGQGTRKTSLVNSLVPGPEFCGELSFETKTEDIPRLMRGKLILELGELVGMRRRELEWIKQFITRKFERWVPKFREFETNFPRRCIFIGTTNRDQFLVDDTGNRRWLPVRTGQCDPDAVARDRDQLWAEARDMHALQGVLHREAERLALAELGQFEETDAWLPRVEAWLSSQDIDGAPIRERPFFRTADVLGEALRFELRQMTKADEMHAARVLRACGFDRVQRRVAGRREWVYVTTVTTSSPPENE